MSNRVLIFVISLIIVSLGLFIFLGGDGEKTASDVDLRSDNKIGVSEKNVVLIEAYSLGCPACAQYHPILKQIREEYKDKIIFQVVHFPLTANFQNARAGHRAVEAAGRQGKFWEMHDTLFEQRELWTGQYTSNPVPQIDAFAEELGLDIEKFREDFRSEEINDVISGDEEYLKSLGVDATPTFFLNGNEIDKVTLSTIDGARSVLNTALGITEEEVIPEIIEETPEEADNDGTSEQPSTQTDEQNI